MSTAFFPTNMRRQPASGFNNKSTYQNIPYVPSKGVGLFSNPVGVTSTHIRPLTNNDPGNMFPTGFGLPRPMKHYRKGRVIPININVLTLDPANEGKYIEQKLIEYNLNRAVKSSKGQSLGGGDGGTGLISQMMGMPGSFLIKDPGNQNNNLNVGLDYVVGLETEGLNIDKECTNCNGVGIVSSWKPISNLTEKPESNVTNPLLCCNQQRKALQRVLPANTNLKKNYYQTNYMYLYNRCQTFKQRQFNFVIGEVDKNILQLFLTYPFVTAKILEYSKPGDPLSLINYYVAQCNPNFTTQIGAEIAFVDSLSKQLVDLGYLSQSEYTYINKPSDVSIKTFIQSMQEILPEQQYKLVIDYMYQLAANPYTGELINGPSNPKGCARVMYKPNNAQYAKQGAVANSTRILKLNVDTISTAAASQRKLKGSGSHHNLYNDLAGKLTYQSFANVPFIYKDKYSKCQLQTYIGNPFFFSGQHQNKLICSAKNDGQQYHTYNSVNMGSAGNYIGSTQSGGNGMPTSKQDRPSTYFNNIRIQGIKNLTNIGP
jgi:hypothetical protein